MSLPFTPTQFFEVFQRYNEAVWPAQIALGLLAAAAVGLVIARRARPVFLILALLWAWMGLAYHLAFFRAINPVAALFGVAFLIAAADFFWNGVLRERLQLGWPAPARAAAGLALMGYALVGYPLVAVLAGQAYPAMPTFGLPCPGTIFTAGVLLFLKAPYPRHVLLVPLAWTLIGVQAALLFGVSEDFGLLGAAAALAWLALPQCAGRVRVA